MTFKSELARKMFDRLASCHSESMARYGNFSNLPLEMKIDGKRAVAASNGWIFLGYFEEGDGGEPCPAQLEEGVNGWFKSRSVKNPVATVVGSVQVKEILKTSALCQCVTGILPVSIHDANAVKDYARGRCIGGIRYRVPVMTYQTGVTKIGVYLLQLCAGIMSDDEWCVSPGVVETDAVLIECGEWFAWVMGVRGGEAHAILIPNR